jgi:hypothetical protein
MQQGKYSIVKLFGLALPPYSVVGSCSSAGPGPRVLMRTLQTDVAVGRHRPVLLSRSMRREARGVTLEHRVCTPAAPPVFRNRRQPLRAISMLVPLSSLPTASFPTLPNCPLDAVSCGELTDAK